jgi:KamA family protein
LEHKYRPTALFIVNNVCGGICRYCFRKRIFLKERSESLRDLSGAVEYIKKHRGITNVLLTGGDPLTSSTRRLEEIISQLAKIDHVRIIRIGSKIPAFNPYRIVDDPVLLELIDKYSNGNKKIYVMTHFNHPRELTDVAVQAITLLYKAGAVLCNQTPIRRGVNDDPLVLQELLKKLSFLGIPPYYIFQCRPSKGNKAYSVTVEEGYDIFEKAKRGVAGLAKRARYVMSHSTGKIEVMGKDSEYIYFRYHLAARSQDMGRFMSFKLNPDAYWFDDYRSTIPDYSVIQPYQAYGPE